MCYHTVPWTIVCVFQRGGNLTWKHLQVTEKLGGGRPRSSSSSSSSGSKTGGSGKEYAVILNTQEFEEKVLFYVSNGALQCEILDVIGKTGVAKQGRMVGAVYGAMVRPLPETEA
jgi:hypothetical protein